MISIFDCLASLFFVRRQQTTHISRNMILMHARCNFACTYTCIHSLPPATANTQNQQRPSRMHAYLHADKQAKHHHRHTKYKAIIAQQRNTQHNETQGSLIQCSPRTASAPIPNPLRIALPCHRPSPAPWWFGRPKNAVSEMQRGNLLESDDERQTLILV